MVVIQIKLSEEIDHFPMRLGEHYAFFFGYLLRKVTAPLGDVFEVPFSICGNLPTFKNQGHGLPPINSVRVYDRQFHKLCVMDAFKCLAIIRRNTPAHGVFLKI